MPRQYFLLPALSVGALALLTPEVLAAGSWEPLLAVVSRGAGGYFSLFKLIAVAAMLLIWSTTSAWVNQDAHGLKLDAVMWNSCVVFSGIVGLGALFVLQSFILALALYLVLFLAPVLSYVFGVRNPSVPERAKVLTADHLQHLLAAGLSKVGIHLGGKEGGEGGEGPPIVFIGKTSSGRADDQERIHKAQGSRGFMGAKELVYDAIVRRATDIHLEPTPDELVVRYRIDGILHNSEPFDRRTGDALINVFKVLAAMDITERRKPQDGSFGAETGSRTLDFRVATAGASGGEKMVIRILDSSSGIIKLAKLGMSKNLIAKVQSLALQPYGLMLCAGPTGAGKSTTLYACLQEIDRFSRNIITIEDPVEYHLDSVTQIEINSKAGQTFAGSLRSVLRQDPDVILIGEIRDKETAEIACQSAQTGHMVFSTVHANDSISTVYRLLDLGVDPGNLGTALSAVIAQRLVRLLCLECREAYKPSSEMLKKAGLANKGIEALYRPPKERKRPCEKCSATGYFGRAGVFEALVVSDNMRDMIRDRVSLRDFKHEARRGGTEYLIEYAIKLVAHGRTSIQEVMRVVK